MRSRKEEKQALISLLSEEHDSVEDLADAVWKTIDTYRKEHDAFAIVANHGGGVVLCYGLYDTMNAASKALGHLRSTTGSERCRIVKVLPTSKVFDTPEDLGTLI